MPVRQQGLHISGKQACKASHLSARAPGKSASLAAEQQTSETPVVASAVLISRSLDPATTYAPLAFYCRERSGRGTSSPREKLWTFMCIRGRELHTTGCGPASSDGITSYPPKFCIRIADAISDFSSFKFTHVFFCIKKKANKLFHKMFLIYLTHPTNFLEASKYIYIIRWAFLCNYHKILTPLTGSFKAVLINKII